MDRYVIVTGGGTGGHLSVAKAFIQEFYSRNYKVIFIGSTKGQDKLWFENESKIYKAYFMDTRGVVNQSVFGKIVSLWLILKAIVKSVTIIKKYNIKKAISVGGFSAAPASFASIVANIDLYIHEQNSVVGKLNKITAKFAKELFCSYIPSSKVKDYPIKAEFFQRAKVRDELKTIIFLGGSQGAKAINDFAIKVAPILKEKNIKIIHQTGKGQYDQIKQKYADIDIDVDLFDFSTKLLDKMEKADFAVSRSGASTLWELVALGIPTFFIPYPYAAANHQYYNAKYLLDNDLCYMQTEQQLDVEYFKKAIQTNNKQKSEKLITLIKPDAVKNIVDIIVK
jgi:UDP-N-acetylglucosamine--N-acetylmuramyl-(pentapeptide) pyrophosphoryl-undecaprenol N-acetylglucosamine transferase